MAIKYRIKLTVHGGANEPNQIIGSLFGSF